MENYTELITYPFGNKKKQTKKKRYTTHILKKQINSLMHKSKTNHISKSITQWFSTGGNFYPPRGHLVMSRDIFWFSQFGGSVLY